MVAKKRLESMFGVSWTSVGVSTQETIKGLAAVVLCNASAQWRGAVEQKRCRAGREVRWAWRVVSLRHIIPSPRAPVLSPVRGVQLLIFRAYT